jgi:hypothetical protein
MSGKGQKSEAVGKELRPADWNRMTKQLVNLAAATKAAQAGKPKG